MNLERASDAEARRARPAPIAAINDFVVKFANVYGSGSA